jgi:hypothetical protein
MTLNYSMNRSLQRCQSCNENISILSFFVSSLAAVKCATGLTNWHVQPPSSVAESFLVALAAVIIVRKC